MDADKRARRFLKSQNLGLATPRFSMLVSALEDEIRAAEDAARRECIELVESFIGGHVTRDQLSPILAELRALVSDDLSSKASAEEEALAKSDRKD